MIIHPLWFLCLSFRTILPLLLLYNKNNLNTHNKTKLTIFALLLIIGLGFLYKYITGSNNETQLNKVFWHNVRIIHFLFYISASLLFIYNFYNIAVIFLLADVVFSISYRLYTNQ